jgi:thiamine phosphate synthase YjbQ (UPF0047 family)
LRTDNGTVTIFSPSATTALTTIEYESGCVADFQRLFDEIADPLDPMHTMHAGVTATATATYAQLCSARRWSCPLSTAI